MTTADMSLVAKESMLVEKLKNNMHFLSNNVGFNLYLIDRELWGRRCVK